MADRYFFDKRDVKKLLVKYGIFLAIAVPILLVINYLFTIWFNAKSMVFLDIVFLCVILVIYEAIWYAVKKKSQEKRDEK